MNAKDPVYAVKLTVFVRDSLQQCQQVFGEQNFQAMMASVESSVIDKLQSFVQSERYAVPLYQHSHFLPVSYQYWKWEILGRITFMFSCRSFPGDNAHEL